MTVPTNLRDIPPELFTVFASHLPLHATPSSLLSLALVNRQISEIVLPLLPSCIVLKYEIDASKMMQRLLANPALGLSVRELHIMCDLSHEVRNDEDFPDNVVTDLQDVIDKGLLPYIHTLGIKLVETFRDKIYRYSKLRPGFFRNLQSKCPRLKGLALDNIGDTCEDRWLDETELDVINGLSSLNLMFPLDTMVEGEDSFDKLQKNLSPLSRTLHTLSISIEYALIKDYQLLSLNFPMLRSLSLCSYYVDDIAEAMKFWHRHPTLEFIDCTSKTVQNFFESTSPLDFLPNLRHLKADFPDVLALAPILHRLDSLEIYNSYNAQVPYLLQSVLPGGLPKLKSLYIHQEPLLADDTTEGMWYETEEWGSGQFEKHMEIEDISIFDSYMPSIVRGAPNLQELAMEGTLNQFSSLSAFTAFLHIFIQETIGSSLRPLNRLQRVYFSGPVAEDDIFFRGSRILAEMCRSLEVVTNNGCFSWPYLNVRIRRSNTGDVEDIVMGKGFGMQIGNENRAFPV